MKTKKQKIHIVTLGCAKNTVDSEVLEGQLRGNHFEMASHAGEADIAIINTCGFIGDAKKQSIDTILSAVELKKRRQLDKVYVMGCLSERYHAELAKEIPEVDQFFGSNELPNILNALGAEFQHALLGERTLSTPSYSAYLKISEGCDNPCSFCAIPLMRGGHRSKPVDQIMSEVMRLTSKGVKELIVIGQDTTYYGLDIYNERALASLLESLASVKDLEWIRLMYAYPAKFPLDLLPVMAGHANICKYLDMPIQHAADAVLKSMRRGITRRALEELIGTIRHSVPGIALRTTLITGYPNETERDVEELATFMKDVKFERLGIFTYSQEDDTAAFALGDPIPDDEKERRKEYLMDVQREISLARNKEKIGRTVRVLVEGHENGIATGRTEWDAPEVDNEIVLTCGPNRHLLPGEFVQCTITDAVEYDLYGDVIS
ncbi:MAG TPA: 30S ribosomal protein S12 methylthiotransferase RimO [Bacteroidota bacterium]|nr:30S ribosomal protein S12 methylthiotransferase RimO [Bacteroidota bacterium]